MEEVLWCRVCGTNRKALQHEDYVLCGVCSLVLRSYDFFPESQPEQHPVRTCAHELGISDHYAIGDAVVCFDKALCCFRSFGEVAAVCLYIGCSANQVPIMLLDLSVNMRVSVYHLGKWLLRVCEVLRVKIDGFRPPQIDDPVFFIHRFVFFEENNKDFSVLLTALRILAAMKTDYVGGRQRLGGLCAAAVYMAGGFDSLDVDDVVPAVEAVLSPLELVEFDCLASEFRSLAKDYDDRNGSKECMMGNVEDLCPHNNVDKFCHGFCRVCYNRFVKLSEYFSGGSDAPIYLENDGITVPRQDDFQVLCSEKRLSSLINFDALRQVFGDDDVPESTNTPSQESNGTSNAMEQGQAREENCGVRLANSGDAQGREGSANKNDQREEVLANKVRRRFGQPKRRKLGFQT